MNYGVVDLLTYLNIRSQSLSDRNCSRDVRMHAVSQHLNDVRVQESWSCAIRIQQHSRLQQHYARDVKN